MARASMDNIIIIIIMIGLWTSTTSTIAELIQPLTSPTPFVEVGATLRMTCETNTAIEWWREGRRVTPIYPYELHTLFKEPQGSVASTLLRFDIALADGGAYQCRDTKHENDFSMWLTVIHIKARAEFEGTGGRLKLYCSVHGFGPMRPTIKYQWTFNGEDVLRDNASRQFITLEDRMQLLISNPNQADNGLYRCEISFMQYKFSKPLEVNVADLPQPPVAPGRSGRPAIDRLLIFLVIVVACVQFVDGYLRVSAAKHT